MRISTVVLFATSLMANQTTINTNISLDIDLEPNIMQASFTYQNTSKTPEPLLDAFSKINDTVVAFNKKYNNTHTKCKGGQNRISPQYSYKNSVRKFEHYSGSLSYTCRFSDIKAYNTLIGMSMFGSEKITLNPIQWILSDDITTKAKEKLTDELFIEIKRKASHYSSLLDKSCHISKINLGHQNIPSPRPMLQRESVDMVMAKSVSNFQPTKDSQTIKRNASVTYICDKNKKERSK